LAPVSEPSRAAKRTAAREASVPSKPQTYVGMRDFGRYRNRLVGATPLVVPPLSQSRNRSGPDRSARHREHRATAIRTPRQMRSDLCYRAGHEPPLPEDARPTPWRSSEPPPGETASALEDRIAWRAERVRTRHESAADARERWRLSPNARDAQPRTVISTARACPAAYTTARPARRI
jgi:hypothetical protein